LWHSLANTGSKSMILSSLVYFQKLDLLHRDRVCIKIPATPESIIACERLSQLNINTLATCVFSVAQAQAAAQAGCLYVAPYFNGWFTPSLNRQPSSKVYLELNVHFDKQAWEEYKDPAKEHPMSPVIQSIICALKESKTLVMPARCDSFCLLPSLTCDL
jgi:transaldolase